MAAPELAGCAALLLASLPGEVRLSCSPRAQNLGGMRPTRIEALVIAPIPIQSQLCVEERD